MSKLQVQGNASGTGVITLAAPNTNSDVTLSLPARTGGVMVDGPAFSAYASTSQTVTLNTFTKVAINTEFFDTNSNFDTATYRFTPTVAGYYQVNGLIRCVVATTFSNALISIYKNGSDFARGNQFFFTLASSASLNLVVSECIYLNGSTDYVELYGLINGTGTASFDAATSANTSRFSASLVRSAT
jgi:hypothetical protein